MSETHKQFNIRCKVAFSFQVVINLCEKPRASSIVSLTETNIEKLSNTVETNIKYLNDYYQNLHMNIMHRRHWNHIEVST